MSLPQPQTVRVRFESFELDCNTGELFKDGQRLKLQDQPARLLNLLVSHAGSLVTRNEIQEALWNDGEFVEFEHAINVAIKKIRQALDDDPLHPRLIETLPRKGYRFIAPVEQVQSVSAAASETVPPAKLTETPAPEIHTGAARAQETDEATLEREFALPATPARIMFILVQLLYLTVYGLTLTHLHEVASVLGEAGVGWLASPVLIGAAASFPVRLYLIFTVGLGHPAAGIKYRRMLPYLMPWDWLWAPSPFLAAHAIGSGWALVMTALLVYPPISQLILMRSIDHQKNRK